MSPDEFQLHRRQNFLSYSMYHATRINQKALLTTSRRNWSDCKPGSDDHVGELRMIFAEKLWLWMLEYTAGTSIEDLSSDFIEIVADFVNWNESFELFALTLSAEFQRMDPMNTLLRLTLRTWRITKQFCSY